MDDGESKQVAVRLRNPLLAELEQKAREEDRPLAALIRLLCRRGLQQPQAERAA